MMRTHSSFLCGFASTRSGCRKCVQYSKQSGKDWLLGTEVDEHGNFGMRGVVAKMRAHKDGVFTCVRQRGGGHFAKHLGGGETLHCHHSTHTSEELPELNVMTVALPRDGGRSADGATLE